MQHRILAVRSKVLGLEAAPLPVIGPRPLRRVLAAVSQLEPMAFRYIDTTNTLPPEIGKTTPGEPQVGPQAEDSIAQVLYLTSCWNGSRQQGLLRGAEFCDMYKGVGLVPISYWAPQ